jgi:UDPglucose--hexose-1-phosphate uridylyltransferase
MPNSIEPPLDFKARRMAARFIDPDGRPVEKIIEVRTHPLTGRSCRITFARIHEKEAGAEFLPPPPPQAKDISHCPFCRPQLEDRTPRLLSRFEASGRMQKGESILFPNLFPYGAYSAVSLFDNRHFVEIGTADAASYADSFSNCAAYLRRVLDHDPSAVHMAITQNHLPSAGGSLVHPHLQVHADGVPANHQRFLGLCSRQYYETHQRYLLSDYLKLETAAGLRTIGQTGPWQWLAAFAPEGFFELWGIYPGQTSLLKLQETDWQALAQGVINAQRFFRSLARNGYNLGLLAEETPDSRLELRVVLAVRSNYASWVRNDHTGFEVMLGDMATFSAPETTAELARPFWHRP